MLNQPSTFQLDPPEVEFDPDNAPNAPTPRQVADPDARDIELIEATDEITGRLRLAMEVAGNVVVGSALLAGLLAAPGLLGQLAGLI